MKQSDLATIVELAQASICAALAEHLRTTRRPSEVDALHRLAWIAFKCGLAGHTTCVLNIPPCLASNGETCMSVEDIVHVLRMEPLLGWLSHADPRHDQGGGQASTEERAGVDAPTATGGTNGTAPEA